MTARLRKWGIGFGTGLCLLAAVVAMRADWHWMWQGLFWLLALIGMVVASSRTPLPEMRDATARAAQPGLLDGATYSGGHSDGSA